MIYPKPYSIYLSGTITLLRALNRGRDEALAGYVGMCCVQEGTMGVPRISKKNNVSILGGLSIHLGAFLKLVM